MKLLLDEMWDIELVIQLRRRGYDVIAVTERPDLRQKSDAYLLAFALDEGRAIVTENIDDFRALGARILEHGGTHAGIILTTNQRFYRGNPGTLGRIVMALDELLRSGRDLTNLEHWL